MYQGTYGQFDRAEPGRTSTHVFFQWQCFGSLYHIHAGEDGIELYLIAEKDGGKSPTEPLELLAHNMQSADFYKENTTPGMKMAWSERRVIPGPNKLIDLQWWRVLDRYLQFFQTKFMGFSSTCCRYVISSAKQLWYIICGLKFYSIHLQRLWEAPVERKGENHARQARLSGLPKWSHSCRHIASIKLSNQ